MKALTRPLGGLVVVVFLLVFGANCYGQNYVPKPDEEIYGTWANKDHLPQKVVTDPTGYKGYNFMSDSAPNEEQTLTIESKWTDSEGNIWYKTFGKVTRGIYRGGTYQELDKLSKSATVWESVDAYGDFDPDKYPSRIDSRADNYKIYYRAEN